MITLYGIKNCDTVRKAKHWLEANNTTYSYHDFRDDGITAELLKYWVKHVDIKKLINKRSTTWKALPDKTQQELITLIESQNTLSTNSIKNMVTVLIENPTLIKRPVLTTPNNSVTVGFSAKDYSALLG